MKSLLKLVIGLLSVGLCFLPAIAAYNVWSWALAQVPATMAYAGLVKLAVCLALFVTTASITLGLTLLMVVLSATIVAALCE